jgi:hypothetical protein
MIHSQLVNYILYSSWSPLNEDQEKNAPNFIVMFFMQIWTITRIWVIVLFRYMVSKEVFDGFKNTSNELSWNFLMFGKLKHDFCTNKQK